MHIRLRGPKVICQIGRGGKPCRLCRSGPMTAGTIFITSVGGHTTWQVLGEGVRLLANRGITEGRHFSIELFKKLRTRALVYHGTAVRNSPHKAESDCPDDSDSLSQRVADFFRLVLANRTEEARSLVQSEDFDNPEAEYVRFRNEARQLGLLRWQRTDCQPHAIEIEDQAGTLAVVYIRLTLREGERDLKQCWIRINSVWRLIWPGFNA